MLLKKGKRRPSSSHKIMELMHVIKKRLSYTASNYVVRTFSKPLARVHPGFVLCLSSKVVISKLTMQILMRAKLHLSFFLCSLHALKLQKVKLI